MAKVSENSSEASVASRNRPKIGRPEERNDRFPGPYGTTIDRIRPVETPEQRAFRRFPIRFHKPGGL